MFLSLDWKGIVLVKLQDDTSSVQEVTVNVILKHGTFSLIFR